METMIRPAVQGDLSRISEIYAHHVLHGSASFELEPPSPEEISQRWEAVVSQGFPYLVVCRDEHVLGYAYANHFRMLGLSFIPIPGMKPRWLLN